MGKKCFFLTMMFLLAVSPAWANSGGSSATANAAAGAQVTNNNNNISAPTLAPDANASSDQTTTVGINNQPTVFGLGGQGGQASAVVGIDLSNRSKNIYSNRQFLRAGGATPIPVSGNFTKPWENGWNISPIRPGIFRVNRLTKKNKVEMLYNSLHLDIKNLSPSERVSLAGFLFDPFQQKVMYIPPVGKRVGDRAVALSSEYSLEDCKRLLLSWAAENGADQMEIVSIGGRLNPTLRGNSSYFSPTGGALFGPLQEIAGSVVGGASQTMSSTTNEAQPYMAVNIWFSGKKSLPETRGIRVENKNKDGVSVGTPVKATN